jgi:tetratricopeptide (TPR) repeat protein
MKHKKILLVALACGILLTTAAYLFPQEGSGRGRIKGTVMDDEGKPVAGVKITATFSGGKSFDGITDEEGRWAIAGLGTGMFRITAAKEGYQTAFVDQKISQFRNEPIDFTLNKIAAMPEGTPRIDDQASLSDYEAGIQMYEQEQYQEALTVFQDFLAKNPTVHQVRVNIANCYRELEQYPEALAEHQKLLDIMRKEKGSLEGDNMAAGILADMGSIYARQGDLEKASQYFQQSIDVNPLDERLAFNVAEIYFKEGDSANAIKYYLLATEINKSWPRSYRQLGYAYLNQGDYRSALDSFNTFLELAPDDPSAPTIRNLIPSIEKLIRTS